MWCTCTCKSRLWLADEVWKTSKVLSESKDKVWRVWEKKEAKNCVVTCCQQRQLTQRSSQLDRREHAYLIWITFKALVPVHGLWSLAISTNWTSREWIKTKLHSDDIDLAVKFGTWWRSLRLHYFGLTIVAGTNSDFTWMSPFLFRSELKSGNPCNQETDGRTDRLSYWLIVCLTDWLTG